jgi:hypothetical protein
VRRAMGRLRMRFPIHVDRDSPGWPDKP